MKTYNNYIKNAFVSVDCEGAKASIDLLTENNNENNLIFMKEKTKSLNLPISCFLKKTEFKDTFKIHYFIADNEEPICGHGTLVATKFLFDNKLIDSDEITYIPMLTPNQLIKAKIENEFISIFIKTIEPENISLKSTIAKEIIDSISKNNTIQSFNIVKITESELDYTVEITKNNDNLTSEKTIKSIEPDFDAIEKIKLKTNKLCRGIDIVIKNEEKTTDEEPDYITRIFLPLGADIKYKEDPACGSGSAYITRHLIKFNQELAEKELKFYQASETGAFIKVKLQSNDIIKVSGIVK